MFQIYIIEDNKRMAEQIVDWIKEYSATNEGFRDFRYSLYSDRLYRLNLQLPKRCSNKHIYIVDIELNDDMNGFHIAKEIRKHDSHGYLIFLTAHSDLIKDSFNYLLKPLHFIDKGDPLSKDQLHKSLDRICFETLQAMHNNTTEETVYIKYTYLSCYYKINIQDILYIEKETNKRYLSIHTDEDAFPYPYTLGDIECQLPDTFIRCHKSFVLNIKNVLKLERYYNLFKAHFRKGKSCLVSRNYLEKVIERMATC